MLKQAEHMSLIGNEPLEIRNVHPSYALGGDMKRLASRVFKETLSGSLNAWKSIRFLRIYRRFRNFTMVPPSTYVKNLILVETIGRPIKGCVVECGVWKGGMIAGIAHSLGNDRDYYLFDSFEGLPPAKEIDGIAARHWQCDITSGNYYGNCRAGEHFAEGAMLRSGVTRFHIIKGPFEHTLSNFPSAASIAILRLDADWYESTRYCLAHLYKHVVEGGLIIIDDYHVWEGCSKALHDFLSEHSLTDRIRQYDNDVCYIVKGS